LKEDVHRKTGDQKDLVEVLVKKDLEKKKEATISSGKNYFKLLYISPKMMNFGSFFVLVF